MQIIANAINESDCRPVVFGVAPLFDPVPVRVFSNELDFSKLLPSFSNLTRLQLNIQETPCRHEDSTTEQEDILKLVASLKAFAPNLQTLELGTLYAEETYPIIPMPGEGSLDKIFNTLSAEVTFPQIEDFLIIGMAVDYSRFVEYFSKHKGTPKHCSFMRIRATDCGLAQSPDDFAKKVSTDLAAAGVRTTDECSDMTQCG